MLLKYWIDNYKAFYNRSTFQMIPAPRIRQLSYSILHTGKGKKACRALSTSILYGPNAAGKTSLLGALEVLKAIVLEGNIRDKERFTLNLSVNQMKLIPNIRPFLENSTKRKPVTLGVEAVTDAFVFSYEVSFTCENIIETRIPRDIISEKLFIDHNLLFERIGKSVRVSRDVPEKYRNTSDPLKGLDKLALRTEPEELFLTGNFKAFFSSFIVQKIREWFSEKLIILYSSQNLSALPDVNKTPQGAYFGLVNDVAKAFGSLANELIYVKDQQSGQMELCSVFNTKDGKRKLIPSSLYESLGTQRLAGIFPVIANAFLHGSTLLVDELDNSIHPMAIMSLINVFHNDELNKNNAQLIFNTHNPIYLNRSLFRTDEIKFVDRNDDTHYSELYSLSDFGTKGDTRAKNTNNYMLNYFVNRYGAIRNVDFSDIFSKILEENRK